MSEQNQGEQNAAPAELSEENLENVAGGIYIIDTCMPKDPIDIWPPIPIEPTTCF